MAKSKKKEDVKLKVADKLRKEANKSSLDSIKVTEEWMKNGDPKKNKQYENKSRKAEEKADKAYEKYYNYIHKNFSGESINASMDKVVKDKKNKQKFFSLNFLKGLKRK